MAQSYYEILGVERNASVADIKKAYRKLAHQYHPDKNPGDKEAEAKFKEVNNAYQTLSDPQKRTQYDQFGGDPGKYAGGGPGGGAGGFNGGFSGFQNSGFDFNFGGVSGGQFEDINDVFETFFGGGAGRSSRGGRGKTSSRRKGIDLEMDIELTLEEASHGVEKEFTVKHNITCTHCSGEGNEPGTNSKTCPTCKGSGRVYQRMQTFFGVVQQETQCPTCEGFGKVFEQACTVCHGKGFTEEKEQVGVKIPAGIDSGDRIRVSGKGQAGYRGSDPGDLYLNVHIAKHQELERRGTDIYSTVEIPFVDILLGTQIDVYTVHGELEVKVPELTNPGTKLRLKEKGMPKLNSGHVGDHFVEVKVKLPKKLTKDQKTILQKLRTEIK
jgi:molecular chaperone DnaJ